MYFLSFFIELFIFDNFILVSWNGSNLFFLTEKKALLFRSLVINDRRSLISVETSLELSILILFLLCKDKFSMDKGSLFFCSSLINDFRSLISVFKLDFIEVISKIFMFLSPEIEISGLLISSKIITGELFVINLLTFKIFLCFSLIFIYLEDNSEGFNISFLINVLNKIGFL